MRRKLDELRQCLGLFLDQRESLVLVLDVDDDAVAYVLKLLDVVEQERPADVFLLFAHPLVDAESYMAGIMESVRAQIEGANAIRVSEELEPWPSLPPGCTDPSRPPAERLELLLAYVRERLPAGDHHVVLGLLPLTIETPAAYAAIVGGLLPRHGLEPWMTRVRILVRDRRAARFLIPTLERNPVERVLFYHDLDLTPDAMTRALAEDAVDPDQSEAERMVALVQLAALDFSHRRYDESLAKWAYLHDHYRRAQDPAMQAMCLGGAADVLRRTDRLAQAKERYQQGLALATDMAGLPVALNLLMGVGEVCIMREEWTEAEGYLALADQLASKLQQVFPKCDIMDRHAVTLVAVGRIPEARAKWRAAADLSREMRHYVRSESALTNLAALCERIGLPAEAREHRRELDEVQRERETFEAEARA